MELEFESRWQEWNSERFRWEELSVTKDFRCFYRCFQMGDSKQRPIEISAADAFEWCKKYDIPPPRGVSETIRIEELRLAEQAKVSHAESSSTQSSKSGTVGTEQFDVFDEDAEKAIIFDESQFQCWGPFESQRGWTTEGCPEWSSFSFVYRHDSGQWLEISESFYWEADTGTGKRLKRITPENAATILALDGFRLPDDLAEFRKRFEFDPSVKPASEQKSEEVPLVLTRLQKSILKALDGKALKKTPLAEIVSGGDGSRLYKAGGINELKDRNKVQLHKRLGYYRPDRPPPELRPDVPQDDEDDPF